MLPQKSFFQENNNKQYVSKLLITILLLLVIVFVYKIINIVILLIVALFLNILFAPILNRFNKWHIRDPLWIILIYIAIIVFVIMMFYSVVPIFIKQISILVNISYDFVNDTLIVYNSKGIEWLGLPKFIEWLLINVDLAQILHSIQANIWQISQFVSDNLKNFLTSGAGVIFSITNIVMNFVLVFIFTFFIALERKNIRVFFYKILPENSSQYILKHENKIVSTLFNWLKSQFILWVSLFIITYIWLLILQLFWIHIEEKFTLALVAGMMEFVPYVGPFIALLPAIAIALGISWQATIAVLILYIIIQQLENNVLVPYVMGKTLSLSPFSVLIAMVIGASLFGIIWIIISVPLVAVIQIFLNPYLEKRKEVK